MRNNFIQLLPIILPFIACKSSPEDLIVNRWKPVGVYGDTQQKERYKERFERDNQEFEFSKDGKFFGYNNGELQGTATYVMAPDGKSLVLSDNGQNATMKIIKLEKNRLEAIMRGFMSSTDTIIFEPGK